MISVSMADIDLNTVSTEPIPIPDQTDTLVQRDIVSFQLMVIRVTRQLVSLKNNIYARRVNLLSYLYLQIIRPSMNQDTMSSCPTIPDPRDLQDEDFQPNQDDEPAPTITVTNYFTVQLKNVSLNVVTFLRF